MTGGIREFHDPSQNLIAKDTSDYRVRTKTVNAGTADEKSVYKVDSKLKQIYVKALSSIGIEKGSYLEGHQIRDHFQSKIDFKEIQHNHDDFALAVIALKKEMNSTNNPESVLKEYSPDVRAALLITLNAPQGAKIPDEDIKQEVKENTDEKAVMTSLVTKHESGINFETGKQDLGQVADRIMNSNTPLTDLDNYSDKVCGQLFLKSQGFGEANVAYASSTNPREDLKTIVQAGRDLKTGKKDLDAVASRLIASSDPKKALESYSDDLKAILLKNTNQNGHAHYIMDTFAPNSSTDEKLATLAKFGISVHTGEIVDRQKFRKEFAPYQWKGSLVSEQTPQLKEMLFQKRSQNEDMKYLMDTRSPPGATVDLKLKTLEKIGIDVQTGKISSPQILAFELASRRSDADPEKKIVADHLRGAIEDIEGHLSNPEPGQLKKLFSGEIDRIARNTMKKPEKKELAEAAGRIMANPEEALKSCSNEVKNALFQEVAKNSDLSFVIAKFSFGQEGELVDLGLTALAKYGINVQTGKVSDPEKLITVLTADRYATDLRENSGELRSRNYRAEAEQDVKAFMKNPTSFRELFSPRMSETTKIANQIMLHPGIINTFSDEVKDKILNNIKNREPAQFVLTYAPVYPPSSDQKLSTLLDHGIDLGTGKIVNPENLAKKLAEYRYVSETGGNASDTTEMDRELARTAVKDFMNYNAQATEMGLPAKTLESLFKG